MNFIVLSGRLTASPELRQTQNGKNVATFRVAVDRDKNKTDFIRCEAWDKTADVCVRYLNKGSKVLVEGSLNIDEWEKDGQKRTMTRVLVRRVEFLETKQNPEATVENTVTDADSVTEDDFPF